MIINKIEQFKTFTESLSMQETIVVDCETTGLDVWGKSKQCGIGFYFPADNSSYYLPFRHEDFDQDLPLMSLFGGNAAENLPLEVLPNLWAALNKPSLLIGHNIKFDLAALHSDGFQLAEHQNIEDTRNGARIYFTEQHPDMSLENCIKELLGVDQSAWKEQFKTYLKKRKIKDAYFKAEVPVIAEYCETDCKNTWLVREKVLAHAIATEQLDIYEREKKILRIVWFMECDGLNLDKDYIQKTIPELKMILNDLQVKLNEAAGRAVGAWSNEDLTLLFAEYEIKPLSYTEKGAAQWTSENLEKIDMPLADLILEWRSIDKLLSTFFIPYSKNESGVVHASFNNSGAVTGRFTCSNPNLQQLSRNEEREIQGWDEFDVQVRKMFIPPPGYSAYYMDYSQMEMLVYADYLEDDELDAKLNATVGGLDFHSLVAKLIWNVDESQADFKDYRRRAKSISLGLIYGMGLHKLAKSIGGTVEEAQKYKDEYFKVFPKTAYLLARIKHTIQQRGYVFNRFGRRYYLHPEQSYVAINYMIQGTSADIIKSAMMRIDQVLKPTRSTMNLQMHDEFGFYLAHDEEEQLLPLVHKAMEEQVIRTFLPATISKANPNWSEKIDICRVCYKIQEKDHKCGQI